MAALSADQNLVLIGMPGAGKSTAGVLLAKRLSRPFVDTDLLIQAAEGRRLAEIIGEQGMEGFCAIEARHVLGLDCRGAVVATGGSVVYGEEAMRHLRASGMTVYLDPGLDALKRRLGDHYAARGVVIAPGESIEALHAERAPLYERYADLRIDAAGLDHDAVCDAVIAAVAAGKR